MFAILEEEVVLFFQMVRSSIVLSHLVDRTNFIPSIQFVTRFLNESLIVIDLLSILLK